MFTVVEQVQFAVGDFIVFGINRNEFSFRNGNGTKTTVLGNVMLRISIKFGLIFLTGEVVSCLPIG